MKSTMTETCSAVLRSRRNCDNVLPIFGGVFLVSCSALTGINSNSIHTKQTATTQVCIIQPAKLQVCHSPECGAALAVELFSNLAVFGCVGTFPATASGCFVFALVDDLFSLSLRCRSEAALLCCLVNSSSGSSSSSTKRSKRLFVATLNAAMAAHKPDSNHPATSRDLALN